MENASLSAAVQSRKGRCPECGARPALWRTLFFAVQKPFKCHKCETLISFGKPKLWPAALASLSIFQAQLSFGWGSPITIGLFFGWLLVLGFVNVFLVTVNRVDPNLPREKEWYEKGPGEH
jgi:uncharacterized protein (DUF983 family)